MAFEMSAAGKFTQVTLNSGSVTTEGNLVLYQCVDGQCLQTDGYIKATSKYAISSSDKSLTKSESGSDDCSESNSNYGKLGTTDSAALCLSEDSKSIAFPTAAGANGYLLKGTLNDGSPFKINKDGIILSVYAYAIIHDQFKEGK